MSQPDVKKILSAPLTLVREATEKEKSLFSDKQTGWIYTFGLSSGQSFVTHIADKEDVFTFRPLNNLLPHLKEIKWEKKDSVADLGYNLFVQLNETTTPEKVTPSEVQNYTEALRSKPISSENFPLTKIAFKYYTHVPMLKRVIDLKQHIQRYVTLRAMLLKAQKELNSTLISEREPQSQDKIFQQKINERRQNG